MERRALIRPPKRSGNPALLRTTKENGVPLDECDDYVDDDDAEDSIMEGLGEEGFPRKYRIAYDKVVRNMRLAGFTVEEICLALGVKPRSINRWKNDYPSFKKAWKSGGKLADARVARAMFKRAIGYKHPAMKIFNGQAGVVQVPYTERYPPDTGAGIFWMTNRQGELWKSTSKQELTGANGTELQVLPPSINVMVIQSPKQRALIDQTGARETESASV